jgi:hypothetical protein
MECAPAGASVNNGNTFLPINSYNLYTKRRPHQFSITVVIFVNSD